jgi:hypothetical protein
MVYSGFLLLSGVLLSVLVCVREMCVGGIVYIVPFPHCLLSHLTTEQQSRSFTRTTEYEQIQRNTFLVVTVHGSWIIRIKGSDTVKHERACRHWEGPRIVT